ncbi:MAG: dihydroorotate dehydrogenase electron transfer subunit [Phycisphaerales bacterium]|nr:MAG: dihydroorotate dehydrogenase electron transfer subunit [Phycisphaerales bacterium]
MTQTRKAAPKGPFRATVTDNVRIGACFWRMDLRFEGDGAGAFGQFRPGQFLQIDVADVALPPVEKIPASLRDGARRKVLLRRPFSFAEVTPQGETTMAELLYCVVGPATLRMTTLARHDTVSVIGPLGNGFWVPENKRTALLVVGGMGVPPIRCLAKMLSADHPNIKTLAFVGAKTVGALPFEGDLDTTSEELGFCVPAFAKFGIPSVLATDDGSAGAQGFVTEHLAQWLDDNAEPARDEMIVYACGPEPMLTAVAKLATRRGIDCQVSMERRMACGIGLCQSCAIECRAEGSAETVYRLCCQDGPVFEAKNVVWEP